MGCDINFFIEKHCSHNRWERIYIEDTISGIRDYSLFTLLAGVRDTGIKGRINSQIPCKINNYLDMDPKLVEKLELSYERHDRSYHNHIVINLTDFLSFNWNMKWDGDYDRPNMEEPEEYCESCGRGKNEKSYTYRDAFPLLLEMIEIMKKFDNNPENIRAVIAFDT